VTNVGHGLRVSVALAAQYRRILGGAVFAVVTVLACALLGRQLTGSSWPLAHARLLLVIAAGVCYFVSFVLRARGWRRLFPRDACPDQARCLASVGAAAASGVVLPFRLDYLVKIGTLRQGPPRARCRGDRTMRQGYTCRLSRGRGPRGRRHASRVVAGGSR
jgi:hypothetical protein